ncbi:MAG: MIP family channel protein [Acidobacteria bacterium]|nr:MIP family channel protein [Acidobacteriota bacterium]
MSEGRNGSYLAVNVGWGLGVALGVYISAGISGAHINPAISVAFALRRGFPWKKVIPYSVAQTAGAFTAAAIVFAVYREAFTAFDGGTRMITGVKATAGIFATYPQPFLSIPGGLVDQVFGTALLVLLVCALTDRRNSAPEANLGPLLIGLLVVAIGICFGFNSGYAINPARDLGPRLFTWIAGWGTGVFTAGNYWFWVPIVGPLVGACLGVWIYDAGIGRVTCDDCH